MALKIMGACIGLLGGLFMSFMCATASNYSDSIVFYDTREYDMLCYDDQICLASPVKFETIHLIINRSGPDEVSQMTRA
jgi:hypothetical protein